MEAQTLLLKLHDESAGYPVTPGRVPLMVLRTFIADVGEFLKGDEANAELTNVDVAVVEGSLGLQTPPLADPVLWSDLRRLASSELLDSISPRRRKVVERWQAQARSSRRAQIELISPALPHPVVIGAQTDFHADDADQWVRVERYLRGEVEDLGGAAQPNAHIRLPDGKRLKVGSDRNVLRDDKVNRLYKPAMVRITAEYNVVTREYRNARLMEFVEHDTRIDERELDRLFERGAKAWHDVPSATDWVEEQRGNLT